jgi:hypothetical protein
VCGKFFTTIALLFRIGLLSRVVLLDLMMAIECYKNLLLLIKFMTIIPFCPQIPAPNVS